MSIQLVKYLLFRCTRDQDLQVASHLIAQVKLYQYCKTARSDPDSDTMIKRSD